MLALMLGCTAAGFAPVSAHCGTEVSGYEPLGPPDDAAQALDQVNCYRTLLGLTPAVLDPRLDQAATAHAEYMDAIQELTHQEQPGTAGFTGERVWDRIDAAGYDLGQHRVSELVAVGPPPRQAIDAWMNSVYHREVLTVEGWQAMGFGSSGDYTALAAVFEDPTDAVIYPTDRQDDVPVAFDSDAEAPDPLPDHGVVGSPMSVTGRSVESATLTGPEGDVELLVLRPGGDEDLDNMTAFLPVEPLQRASVYTFSVVLGNGTAVRSEFRTIP